MNFAGKTIFITGASRGIGQSVAKHFKEYGGFVIGTKTNSSSVNHDYCHEWLQADFSSEKEILECSKFIKSRKDIDIDRYLEALSKDKKNIGSEVKVILTRGMGKMFKTTLPMTNEVKILINDFFEKRLYHESS
jgi:NAD(P)-dependent dehydrogenase (short-subunit alcohol dehydrogenase family)